ncbi:MAG: hypothetical protein HZB38_08200 [Planctomycetes bacterium]|nr:hypothetical protein [Planctomycetota bacterium]
MEAGGRIHVFDDRLDKLASIANPGFVVCAPDDANGDGRLELLLEVHRGGVSDDPGLFALIQLGQQQYLLVAAFLSSEAYGGGWYEQYWIDAPSARRCDLAFVRSTPMPSGVLVPQSKLVFHWNEDGILTGDDPALAKFKCWLADSKGPIPCNPDQPLIDIVETALWRPEKLRR